VRKFPLSLFCSSFFQSRGIYWGNGSEALHLKAKHRFTYNSKIGNLKIACWINFLCFYRFVRFVSTPEILERVYTIESEIIQIEEAIAIQGNNLLGIGTVSKYLTAFLNSTTRI